MKKIFASVLVLGLAAAGTLTLTAFRHHRDPAHMAAFVNGRLDKLLDEVSATDAQRTQIHAIADKLLADGKALHAGQGDLRAQLLAEWTSASPDAGKVHALINGRVAAAKTFADEAADAILQVHSILTPEQRAKVAQKMGRHHHVE